MSEGIKPTRKVIRLKKNNEVKKEFATSPTMNVFSLGGENAMVNTGLKSHRGINVYNISQIMNVVGRDKEGRLLTWGVEQPYFYLTVPQRTQIFEVCAPVFGIVSSRMKKISSMDFKITPMKNHDDRIADELKSFKQIYKEREAGLDPSDMKLYVESLTIRNSAFQGLKDKLPELLPDLSNFDGCLLRWKRRIQNAHMNMGEEIQEWLLEPNAGLTWENYIQKYIFDLHVHGSASIYKQWNNGKLENFDVLPGGTMYPFKLPWFSTVQGYIQIVGGLEPQTFFGDEISYLQYLPTSVKSMGMIPLEAIINQVAEYLLFDKKMADEADGTKPPEKLIIVTNNQNPFGDMDNPEEVPLDPNEEKRIETKVNTPRQYPIMIMSGNKAEIFDLTRDQLVPQYQMREDKLREIVGLVFNASNMEMNLTDTGGVIGQNSSEEQGKIDKGRGIYPICKSIAGKITKDIIPFRFGEGYELEFGLDENEDEEIDLILKKQQAGLLTQNETRELKLLSTFDGDEYNLPVGDSQSQPDGSQQSPFNFRGVR